MTNKLPDIRKTVVVDAPIDTVWKAVATSEGIAGWFMPNTFKPVLNATFVLHAGPFGDSPCVVTEFEEEHSVGFDWDTDWHLSFQLQPMPNGKTQFTLVHAGWDGDKSVANGQPHAVIRGIMDQGWEKKVQESLPQYVAGLSQ